MSYLTFTALLNVLWKGLFHALVQLCRMAMFGQRSRTDEQKCFTNITGERFLGKLMFPLDILWSCGENGSLY